MHVPVLVERLAWNHYRARSGEPLVLKVEGPSRDDVLRQLREQITAKLLTGAELVQLDVPAADTRGCG